MIDPIDSRRHRKRAPKRGTTGEFFCGLIGEQVLIAVRRRTGALRWQDAFVWCSRDDCQHNGTNAPRCPLHGDLFAACLAPDPVRCAVRNLPIAAHHGEVARRWDGRVRDAHCPYPACLVCARAIFPGDPVQRDHAGLAHQRCWTSRPRPTSGGVSVQPWTALFDARMAVRVSADPWVLTELRAVIQDVVTHAADTRAWARHARATTARLRQRAA